jgi:hypothetical protein
VISIHLPSQTSNLQSKFESTNTNFTERPAIRAATRRHAHLFLSRLARPPRPERIILEILDQAEFLALSNPALRSYHEHQWRELPAQGQAESPVFLFFEGEWELADKRLIAKLEQSRTTGNRLRELEIVLDLARLHRFTGEHAEAVQFLRSGGARAHILP